MENTVLYLSRSAGHTDTVLYCTDGEKQRRWKEREERNKVDEEVERKRASGGGGGWGKKRGREVGREENMMESGCDEELKWKKWMKKRGWKETGESLICCRDIIWWRLHLSIKCCPRARPEFRIKASHGAGAVAGTWRVHVCRLFGCSVKLWRSCATHGFEELKHGGVRFLRNTRRTGWGGQLVFIPEERRENGKRLWLGVDYTTRDTHMLNSVVLPLKQEHNTGNTHLHTACTDAHSDTHRSHVHVISHSDACMH